MIWLLAGGAIASLYLLLGLAVLVWSAPPAGEPNDLTGGEAAMLVLGWFPMLVIILVRGVRR